MKRSLVPLFPVVLLVGGTAVIATAAYLFIRPSALADDNSAHARRVVPRGSGQQLEVKPLQVKLAELQAYLAESQPDAMTAMNEELGGLRDAGYGQQAPQVGSVMPDFDLPASDRDGTVRLSQLTEQGPVVICWFRGTWCPFCRSELQSLTELQDEIRAAGATIIGISPQLTEFARRDAAKHGITFPLLHDRNNRLAHSLHLVYPIPPRILAAYRDQLDLTEQNGRETVEEPIPATFLVDRDRVIRFAYVDPDFRTRMNPDDMLAALRRIPRQ